MICALLYVMWVFVWYVSSFILCGLLDIRVAVYVVCCIVGVLLYDMWPAGCMGCSICGLLNDM